MLKPLVLGNKTFPVNLIQGPLAGVSCAPFRRLIWKYSQPAFSCTEMLSCKAIIYQSKDSHRRYTEKDPNEGSVCFQLSASEPQELIEATKIVTDYGADLIDLNCGCPVRKIWRKKAGAYHLTEPTRLYHLIRSMKQNTHVPISIKIRVEGSSGHKFNGEIAKVVAEAGADFLIVHGRHWTENYSISCHYDNIQFFVEELKIPVIGNGDVSCIKSLNKMLTTGCAGVMISRASVGQPWLIGKLIAAMRNSSYTTPSNREIGNIFIEHIRLLKNLLDNEHMSLLQARKLAKYYSRGISNRADFCVAVNTCSSVSAFETLCKNHFH